MARQQATLNVHSRYLHEAVIDFCERLAGLHQRQIESVILSCSGTEANEVRCAWRFATGKLGISAPTPPITATASWSISLTRLGQQPSSNPSVRAFPFPETFRPIAPRLSKDGAVRGVLARLAAAIADLLPERALRR